jgi:hypothetical protein
MKRVNRILRRLSVLLIVLLIGSTFIGISFASNSYSDYRTYDYGTWTNTGSLSSNAMTAQAKSQATTTMSQISVSMKVLECPGNGQWYQFWSGSSGTLEHTNTASISTSWNHADLYDQIQTSHMYYLIGHGSWVATYQITDMWSL